MKVSDLRKLELHEKRWIAQLMETRMFVINSMVRYRVTEEEIAKRSGLTIAAIKNIINANQDLTMAQLARLEVCFGELLRESVAHQIDAEAGEKKI